jgi:hypothetical protein
MKQLRKLIKSDWIDELSEEEEQVLKKGARIDQKMHKNKPFKIGLLK